MIITIAFNLCYSFTPKEKLSAKMLKPASAWINASLGDAVRAERGRCCMRAAQYFTYSGAFTGYKSVPLLSLSHKRIFPDAPRLQAAGEWDAESYNINACMHSRCIHLTLMDAAATWCAAAHQGHWTQPFFSLCFDRVSALFDRLLICSCRPACNFLSRRENEGRSEGKRQRQVLVALVVLIWSTKSTKDMKS